MNTFNKAACDKFKTILTKERCNNNITSYQYKTVLGQIKKSLYDDGCISFFINNKIDLNDIVMWLRSIIIASWQGGRFSNNKCEDEKYIESAIDLLSIISKKMLMQKIKYIGRKANPDNLMRKAYEAFAYSHISSDALEYILTTEHGYLAQDLYVEKTYNPNNRIYSYGKYYNNKSVDWSECVGDASHPV